MDKHATRTNNTPLPDQDHAGLFPLLGEAFALVDYIRDLYERAELRESLARADAARGMLMHTLELYEEELRDPTSAAAPIPTGGPEPLDELAQSVFDACGPVFRDFLDNVPACLEADPLPSNAEGEPLPGPEAFALDVLMRHHERLPSVLVDYAFRDLGLDLLEPIAESGFSIVFLAYDRALGRKVRVKAPVIAEYGQEVERALERMPHRPGGAHPGFLALYRTLRAGPWLVLVCEHFAGASLADASPDPAAALRDEEQAEFIAYQVLDALDALHSAGACHGNLKPGHVLVGSLGAVRVLDLWSGAAGLRAYHRLASIHESEDLSAVLGRDVSPGASLRYLSPEAADGHFEIPGDVHAMGRMLPLIYGVEDESELPAEVRDLASRMTLPDPDQRPGAGECRDFFAAKLSARGTLLGRDPSAAAEEAMASLVETAQRAERARGEGGLPVEAVYDFSLGMRHESLANMLDYLRNVVAHTLQAPVQVAVFGSYSAGKSTLLNHLLLHMAGLAYTPENLAAHARHLRPTGEEPTDASVTLLRRATDEHPAGTHEVIHRAGGRDFVVARYLPYEFLDRVTLVDTPGFQEDPERDALVRGHVENCDLILHVLLPTSLATASDDALIRYRMQHFPHVRVVYVINFIDIVVDRSLDLRDSEEQVLAAAQRFGKRLEQRLGELENRPVSLMPDVDLWYASGRYDFRMDELARYVRHVVEREAPSARLRAFGPRISRQAGVLRTHVTGLVTGGLLGRLEAYDGVFRSLQDGLGDLMDLRVLPALREFLRERLAQSDLADSSGLVSPPDLAETDETDEADEPAAGARVFAEPDAVWTFLDSGKATLAGAAHPEDVRAFEHVRAVIAEPTSPLWSAIEDEVFSPVVEDRIFEVRVRLEWALSRRDWWIGAVERAAALLSGPALARRIAEVHRDMLAEFAVRAHDATNVLAAAIADLESQSSSPGGDPHLLETTDLEGALRRAPIVETESAPERVETLVNEAARDARDLAHRQVGAMEQQVREWIARAQGLRNTARSRVSARLGDVLEQARRGIDALIAQREELRSARGVARSWRVPLVVALGIGVRFFAARVVGLPQDVSGGIGAVVILVGMWVTLRLMSGNKADNALLDKHASDLVDAVIRSVEPIVAGEVARLETDLDEGAGLEARLHGESAQHAGALNAELDALCERIAVVASRAIRESAEEVLAGAAQPLSDRRVQLENAFNQLIQVGEELEQGSLLTCRLSNLRAMATLYAPVSPVPRPSRG